MAWDKLKGGFYCDRCGTGIHMDIRQSKYLGPRGEGHKAGDPYLSVSHHAFFEEGKRSMSGYMYCFDCEQAVMDLLKTFNMKGK